MPLKSDAIAYLGQKELLLPGWIEAALAANDRLKIYLSALQAAAAHAAHPEREPIDVVGESGLPREDANRMRDLVATAAASVDGVLVLPGLARLAAMLGEDLVVMAKPIVETDGVAMAERVAFWRERLAALTGNELTQAQLSELTRGDRADDDSLHATIMDLHRQLNELAAACTTEEIDGAHVWHLETQDRPLVAAFMRGVRKTAPLKFDHPGLTTCATRHDERLLLQNDLGVNDAHVLVVEIHGGHVTLRYSDLHRRRFEFFRAMLEPCKPKWLMVESRVDEKLNRGEAFTFGTAQFDCAEPAALERVLETIGSRIVFLIDWNRARKRLLPFVGKADAIDVLHRAAAADAGHMAWLKCGAESLVYDAMQAAGNGAFRVGDRLDAVLGAADAKAFLVDVLCLASGAMQAGLPPALVADETRLLLMRHVRRRSGELELLVEHAAYCHALAQAVSDGIEHDVANAPDGRCDAAAAARIQELAGRAKSWERQADQLVMRAREQARSQPRWRPIARLLELSDDIADALEEAAFLMSLIVEGHQAGWTDDVRSTLSRLARAVLSATQEHIKALAIAQDVGAHNEAADSDAFVAATWNVLRSEQQCDELLRQARRSVLASGADAATLMLADGLAAALELASDKLLAAGYSLRDLVFGQAGEQP